MKSDLNYFLGALNKVGIRQMVSRGTIIHNQNDDVETINLVISGHAIAQTYTIDGNLIWIDEFSAGDVIGIELWLENARSAFEITARTNLELLKLSRGMLTKMIQIEPEFLNLIIRDSARKLNSRTQRLIESNALSAAGRICAELKRHSKPIGIDPNKHIIRPTPIFSEFALRVGSTRESVSRTVSDLTKTGIIQRQTGALVISNMGKLEAFIR